MNNTKIKDINIKKEKFITFIFEIAYKSKKPYLFTMYNEKELQCVNTREDLIKMDITIQNEIKTKLIQKIQKTSKVFENRANEFYELELVGDVRQKGMLMGVELVNDYFIKTKKSINKIVFDEGRKHNIFFRTLGNVAVS